MTTRPVSRTNPRKAGKNKKIHTSSTYNYGKPKPTSERLRACLADEQMTDVTLVGDDGIPIPALRCILGSTSPALRELLYGKPTDSSSNNSDNFFTYSSSTTSFPDMFDEDGFMITLEPTKSPVVHIPGYNHTTLKTLVQYCCSDGDLTKTSLFQHENGDDDDDKENGSELQSAKDPGEMVLDILDFAQLAIMYEIAKVPEEVIDDYLIPMIKHYPPVACLVFNYILTANGQEQQNNASVPSFESSTASRAAKEAEKVVFTAAALSKLYTNALSILRTQPYEALESYKSSSTILVGGITCLHHAALEQIFLDKEVEADELFLFRQLLAWYHYHLSPHSFHPPTKAPKRVNGNKYNKNGSHKRRYRCPNPLEVCRNLVQHLDLAAIDPVSLKTIVYEKGSDFVSQQVIMEALFEQATTATTSGRLTLSAMVRGPRSGDPNNNPSLLQMMNSSCNVSAPEYHYYRSHVVVKGAGVKGCNGVYTHVVENSNGASSRPRPPKHCGEGTISSELWTSSTQTAHVTTDSSSARGTDASSESTTQLCLRFIKQSKRRGKALGTTWYLVCGRYYHSGHASGSRKSKGFYHHWSIIQNTKADSLDVLYEWEEDMQPSSGAFSPFENTFANDHMTGMVVDGNTVRCFPTTGWTSVSKKHAPAPVCQWYRPRLGAPILVVPTAFSYVDTCDSATETSSRLAEAPSDEEVSSGPIFQLRKARTEKSLMDFDDGAFIEV